MRGADLREEIDTAAVQLWEAFDEAGIAALLLKGPVLARVLYEPGEQRRYVDLDILVDPAAMERARALLQDLGCTCVQEELGVEDPGGGFHSEDWVLGLVTVDLHWRLPVTNVDPETAWRPLQASRQLIDLNGHRVATMSRAGLALHIAIHAAQHQGLHGSRQRDLELALERWPSDVWDEAAALAGEIGAGDAFAAGIQLLPPGRALACRLGLPDVSELNWTAIDAWPRGTYHVRAFASAGSLRDRARIARRALLPPSRWIVGEYPWARRWRPLQIAAYTMHIMRAPAWTLRALRFRRRSSSSSG